MESRRSGTAGGIGSRANRRAFLSGDRIALIDGDRLAAQCHRERLEATLREECGGQGSAAQR
jgi:hypothetical protein